MLCKPLFDERYCFQKLVLVAQCRSAADHILDGTFALEGCLRGASGLALAEKHGFAGPCSRPLSSTASACDEVVRAQVGGGLRPIASSARARSRSRMTFSALSSTSTSEASPG